MFLEFYMYSNAKMREIKTYKLNISLYVNEKSKPTTTANTMTVDAYCIALKIRNQFQVGGSLYNKSQV